MTLLILIIFLEQFLSILLIFSWIAIDIRESEREKNAHAQTGQDKGIRFYGRYDNVILTEKEMEILKSDFPADYQSMIEHLSEYMASYGKTYKNHLATMELWKKADMKKEQKTGKGYSYNGSFKEGDSL